MLHTPREREKRRRDGDEKLGDVQGNTGRNSVIRIVALVCVISKNSFRIFKENKYTCERHVSDCSFEFDYEIMLKLFYNCFL